MSEIGDFAPTITEIVDPNGSCQLWIA